LEQKADGNKLADALGIDTTFLKLVPNANGGDQLEANAMNKALFPATIGYFMEEMMKLCLQKKTCVRQRIFCSLCLGKRTCPVNLYRKASRMVFCRLQFIHE
jgi:hypothetical protein